MRILPISDVHGVPHVISHVFNNIDPDSYDVLTCSGDIWEGSGTGGKSRWTELQEYIKKPIVMIQGNHDYWPSTTFDEFPDIHLLHNECVDIDGVKFFGTPHTVNFCGWNHMRDEETLFNMWDLVVPKGLDVMLSHGPPYGYGDNCNMPVYGNTSESKLGSRSLLAILEDRAPKYVFCGHIHTGDRVTVMDNGTKVYNVSCIDEAYKFMGYNPEPEVIELEL